jgi:tetratricopeptide (TPR) repeat protein
VALYRQLDNRMSLSSCLGSAALRGGCYQGDINVFATASVDECWQLGSEAIQLARQIGWSFGEANANVFLSLAMGVRGEYARSLLCARDAMDLALDIEAPVWQGVTHISFGKTHHDCFDRAAARMHLEQALLLAKGVGAHEFLNTVIGFLASTLIVMGELTAAQQVLQESLALTTSPTPSPEQTGSQRLILCAQAEWLLAQGQTSAALAMIDGLIAVAPHTRAGAGIPRLWHLRGLALVRQNRLAEAERVYTAGYCHCPTTSAASAALALATCPG